MIPRKGKLFLAAFVAVMALVGLLIFASGRNEVPSTAEQPKTDTPAIPQPHAPNQPAPGPTPDSTR